jgi:2'-5' RNA ligase
MLRAFIAIQLSDELKCQIQGVQEELKRQVAKLGRAGGIGWTRAEGIHLTLKFLGDVPEAQVEALGMVIRQVASAVEPFTLEARGVGAFPSLRKPRVVWLGLHGGDRAMGALRQAQSAVEEGCAGLDFPRESRLFTPHLTLARVRDPGPSGALEKVLTQHQDLVVGNLFCGSLALIKSELRPSGAVYATLVEVPLGGGV